MKLVGFLLSALCFLHLVFAPDPSPDAAHCAEAHGTQIRTVYEAPHEGELTPKIPGVVLIPSKSLPAFLKNKNLKWGYLESLFLTEVRGILKLRAAYSRKTLYRRKRVATHLDYECDARSPDCQEFMPKIPKRWLYVVNKKCKNSYPDFVFAEKGEIRLSPEKTKKGEPVPPPRIINSPKLALEASFPEAVPASFGWTVEEIEWRDPLFRIKPAMYKAFFYKPADKSVPPELYKYTAKSYIPMGFEHQWLWVAPKEQKELVQGKLPDRWRNAAELAEREARQEAERKPGPSDEQVCQYLNTAFIQAVPVSVKRKAPQIAHHVWVVLGPKMARSFGFHRTYYPGSRKGVLGFGWGTIYGYSFTEEGQSLVLRIFYSQDNYVTFYCLIEWELCRNFMPSVPKIKHEDDAEPIQILLDVDCKQRFGSDSLLHPKNGRVKFGAHSLLDPMSFLLRSFGPDAVRSARPWYVMTIEYHHPVFKVVSTTGTEFVYKPQLDEKMPTAVFPSMAQLYISMGLGKQRLYVEPQPPTPEILEALRDALKREEMAAGWPPHQRYLGHEVDADERKKQEHAAAALAEAAEHERRKQEHAAAALAEAAEHERKKQEHAAAALAQAAKDTHEAGAADTV